MNLLTTTGGETPLPQPCAQVEPRPRRTESRWRAWLSGHQVASLSRSGPGRAVNEDAVLARRDDRDTVLVVADGVGGGEYPDVASRTVVFAFAERPIRCASELRITLFEADHDVADAIGRRTTRPGGATAVAAHVFLDEAAVSHVGDAGAKLLRRPGWLRRGWRSIPLTRDHTCQPWSEKSPRPPAFLGCSDPDLG